VSHIRTQIRDAMAVVLTAALGANYNVYASRKYPRNLGTSALVDMRFQNENIEPVTMGDLRTRTASLYIRCQRGATEATIDDLLDADEIAIANAIEAQNWDGLLMEQPELVQVNWTDDASSGTAIGGIVLRYDLEYRATTTDFETARD
jgi:hypothetical protein